MLLGKKLGIYRTAPRLMFPSDWAHQTGQKKKRKIDCASAEDKDGAERPCADTDGPLKPECSPEQLELPSQILKTINTAHSTPAMPDELDLDVILSRVPYREILENLFGRDQQPTSDVPVISRAYEESYMREPGKGERACASGELCECNFIDPCMPFTAVEFTTLPEMTQKAPRFCVLCSRKLTQKLFYDILFTGKEVHGVIQRFGNICGVKGWNETSGCSARPSHSDSSLSCTSSSISSTCALRNTSRKR